MDQPLAVTAHIRRLTVNLDDDDVTLFEGRWPVPHGVALHSYLVSGDLAVVVDPWDAGGYGPEEVEADLQTLGLSWKSIAAVAFTRKPTEDLIVRLRQFHPQLKFWGVPTIGIRHDLGSGVILEERDGFWFVAPDGAVLTGGAFAGLGWIEDELWAEDLNEDEARWFEDEALRWFSGYPVAPPRLPPDTLVVAPAHGCLWGRNPAIALERAQRFAAWGRGPALDEVTVVWPAGPDADAEVDALVGGILDAGAGLNLLRVPADEPLSLATGARRASLVVVGHGVDEGFLAGLNKEVWRPDPATSSAALRAEVARRFGAVRQRFRQ